MSFSEKEVNRLAGKAVHRWGMIEDGDRILVCLSGGKDSLAMLEFLAGRLNRVPISYHMLVAHLDLGYEDPDEVAALKRYVEAKGLPGHFERTDYAGRAHSHVNRENPCFLCSRLRRKRLFELARDHGCSKLAMGHHREDFSETLLLNIFFGGQISSMTPVQDFFGGALTVIRPLCLTPEEKIRRYARNLGLPVVENGCPSDNNSQRRIIKSIIDGLAKSNEKVRGNIFRALQNCRPDYLLDDGLKLEVRGRGEGRREGVETSGEESRKMSENQRKRTRVNFKTEVALRVEQEEYSGLKSRDLSLKGIFVETNQVIPEGTAVDLVLSLSGSSSKVELKIKARVARVGPDGLGLDFTEIDLDSFFHLRNIILYNSGQPADVDNELAAKPAF
ncbi:MAG: ATP-binding protein [Pseudomonadota bacterium]